MKKKHKIETIDDIKYCEENGLTIYSYTWEPDFFIFANGVWCMCSDNELKIYNNTFDISYDELYYYEEKKEKQEATEKDIGKLCWFYELDDKRCYRLSVLMAISNESELKFNSDSDRYSHCRPLTKEEIKEFMEKAE